MVERMGMEGKVVLGGGVGCEGRQATVVMLRDLRLESAVAHHPSRPLLLPHAVPCCVSHTCTPVADQQQDDKGKSRCFGFINFAEPEGAAKAVEEMTGKEVSGKSLYAGR